FRRVRAHKSLKNQCVGGVVVGLGVVEWGRTGVLYSGRRRAPAGTRGWFILLIFSAARRLGARRAEAAPPRSDKPREATSPPSVTSPAPPPPTSARSARPACRRHEAGGSPTRRRGWARCGRGRRRGGARRRGRGRGGRALRTSISRRLRGGRGGPRSRLRRGRAALRGTAPSILHPRPPGRALPCSRRSRGSCRRSLPRRTHRFPPSCGR